MRGDIGEKQRQGQTRTECAAVEAEAVRAENARQMETAESVAALKVKRAQMQQQAAVAEVESTTATQLRAAELDATLHQKRAAAEVERLRCEQLARAAVDAEARMKTAEADAAATRQAADAKLHAARADAEAIRARYEAIADGLSRVRANLGGQPEFLLNYLMIEKGVYEKLAVANADAVRGMAPKVTVWHTGPSAAGEGSGSGGGGGGPRGAAPVIGNGASPLAAIADVYRALPPVVTAIHEQTGIRPPAWLMRLPRDHPEAESGTDAAEQQRLHQPEGRHRDGDDAARVAAPHAPSAAAEAQ
jgi:flotillin